MRRGGRRRGGRAESGVEAPAACDTMEVHGMPRDLFDAVVRQATADGKTVDRFVVEALAQQVFASPGGNWLEGLLVHR